MTLNRNTPLGLALGGLILMAVPIAMAADHAEAPGTGADSGADIADLYAWEDGAGQIPVILTFAGLTAAGGSATYDPDVLYGVHVDTDGDQVADHDIWIRVAQDGAGAWGVQFEGIPGGSGTVEGAVETEIDAGNGLKAWIGLRDDPFFFDLQGYTDTLASSTLAFDPTRDSLAGTNVTAIVFTIDAASLAGTSVDVWATTGRI